MDIKACDKNQAFSNHSPFNLNSAISAFQNEMYRNGLHCNDTIIVDGEIHRFKHNGDKNPDGWYILFDNKNFIAGVYGYWKDGTKQKWSSKSMEQLTAKERNDYSANMDRAKEALRTEIKKRHAESQKKAQEIWNKASYASDNHSYLSKKQVKPYGIKVEDERLIIPLHDHSATIHSLQYIFPGGEKRFLPGGAIAGHYYTMGKPTDKLFICEGYATGATIHEATGCEVAVTFNAGNLLSVAKVIKNKCSEKDIIICADNDAFTKAENIGVKRATIAAKDIKAKLIIPKFKDTTTKPTDFNDLMILEGVEEVLKQLKKVSFIPESPEEAVKRLAGLSPIRYAQARKDEAKKLGISVGVLDSEVKKLQNSSNDTEEVNELENGIIPWQHEVSGNEIANALYGLIQKYAVVTEHQITTMVLFVFSTYCIDAFGIFPKLLITSPEKRCGKTTLLSILHCIVHKALPSSNTSPSAIFRSIELWKPTLLVDEGDTFIRNDNMELRGIINSGHTRDTAFVLRTEGDNSNRQPKQFSTWSPMIIAMIKNPPDTILDRSIPIKLSRKLVSDKIDKWAYDNFAKLKSLRQKLKRWVVDNFENIKSCNPKQPSCSNDRTVDNWYPLFCLASVLGEVWTKKIIEAFNSLVIADEYDVDESINVLLLKDIKEIFEEDVYDEKIHSSTLVRKLVDLDERPWAEYRRGKPMTTNTLAKLLKPFSIKSKQLWLDGHNKHGYEITDFEDVFSRYISLTPPVQNARTLEPLLGKGFDENQNARSKGPLVFQNQPNPALEANPSVLAFQKGGIGEENEKISIENKCGVITV